MLLFLPPWTFFKFCLRILRTVFSEDVSGKVVLITGASSGIGEHLAYEYASRGAHLAFSARREDLLRRVADRCLQIGSPDVIVIRTDVSDAHDCKRMRSNFVCVNAVDHLVNNAGISQVCMLEEADEITNLRPVMASKAALAQFYETMRVEFGSDVKITIVTPGFIESELTQGKFLSHEGKMVVDHVTRDMQVNLSPVGKVETTARAIVKQALRGERYVTEPSWMKMSYVWKVLWPEAVEWVNRLMCMTTIGGESPHDTVGKRIMDMIGGRGILYPASIQSSEIKSD
ncbi:hypothetical protein L1987_87184 [Smallanthus sonchifolius]|nr:hypothetical protein L1987_87184 [Smallanthus sonchifolius]